ncbi:MAG: hypothetical protein HWN51_02165 [Desulfobacterales bacterium]|nr:hypothetical protein [Desulfobacterales bacterium]
MVRQIHTSECAKYVVWLYWAYMPLVKFFLYLVVLMIMFYTSQALPLGCMAHTRSNTREELCYEDQK